MTAFTLFVDAYGVWATVAAATVFFVAGLAKGAVGFALPMIAISGLGAFLPAETAIALLILPALISNVWQSFRTGVRAAFDSLWRRRITLVTLLPMIALSAQLVPALDDRAIFLILGVGVTAFSAAQLVGFRPPRPKRPALAEAGVGVVAGFFGGVAGVWGPPILLYLIALDTPKTEQVRTMGVAFLLGSIILAGGHLASGALNAVTIPLSLAMAAPVLAGMALGLALHDRMNADAFRRATLAVLVLAGLNLLRRALTL